MPVQLDPLSSETASASGTCPRCKEWKLYRDNCTCQRFECAQPWNGIVSDVSWCEVYAPDAERAAEKFAENSDSDGDYTIIRNGEAEIWTRDENGTIEKWDIEAESVPSYNARRKR